MTPNSGRQLDGQDMFALAQKLWPIHRSITGDGTRETLAILRSLLPNLVLHEIPSDKKVFDWAIPHEWEIRGATLTDPNGSVILDLAHNSLHVLGYSQSVNLEISLDELQGHLHSIPEQPDAIPFVTSYYHPNWGFCLSDRQRRKLKPGKYHAKIDASHVMGSLTYAELVIPGDSDDELFISTYVCHPSLANNELSGPVVATALALWLQTKPRHYTYRFAFVPETIGALAFTHHRLNHLRERTVAGFNLTCIGDDRSFSCITSRLGNMRVDRIATRKVAARRNGVVYPYLQRGSDERTYCAPGIDLPLVSLMRTKFGEYPEYHTSLDQLGDVVTPSGLSGGLDLVKECIADFEDRKVAMATTLGEPQLGRRGLYHTMLNKDPDEIVMLRTHILAYADGQHCKEDLIALLGIDEQLLDHVCNELEAAGLLTWGHQTPSPWLHLSNDVKVSS